MIVGVSVDARRASILGGDAGAGVAGSPPLALLSSAAVWVDPADLPSMRQGRNGSGAAAVGQPVGFLCNKGSTGTAGRSIEAALGAELVTNGGFDSATGWTLGTGWAISGGAATISGASGSADADLVQNLGIVTGRVYSLTFSYTTTGTVLVWLGSGGAPHIVTAGAGVLSFVISAAAATLDIRLRPSAGVSATIDNISVRELPGSHFVAPSDAARPVLRNSGALWWLEASGTSSLQMPLNLSATDKLTVMAAYRETSSSAAGRIAVEHTAASFLVDGGFYLATRDDVRPTTSLRGTQHARLGMTPPPAYPYTTVHEALLDIAQATRETEIRPLFDGASVPQAGFNAADAGTGNFANSTLNLLSRNGGSDGMVGDFSGLVIATSILSASDRAILRSYLASLQGRSL